MHSRLSNSTSFILGGILYIVAIIQYFLAQIIAASAWSTPYSWNKNYISDLGNTACGISSVPHALGSYVCSPDHALMNISFVLIGVLMLFGTISLKRFFPQGKLGMTAFVLLIVASVGKIMVGLVPENTIIALHTTGALNIPLGNIAVLLLGISLLPRYRILAVSGIIVGIVGLFATLGLGALESGHIGAMLLSLGYGGMERLAGYPADIWILFLGVCAVRESAHDQSQTELT